MSPTHVHVRLYGQYHEKRPEVAPSGDAREPHPLDGALVPHMALEHPVFQQWRPKLIRRGNRPTGEELAPYRLWLEDQVEDGSAEAEALRQPSAPQAPDAATRA